MKAKNKRENIQSAIKDFGKMNERELIKYLTSKYSIEELKLMGINLANTRGKGVGKTKKPHLHFTSVKGLDKAVNMLSEEVLVASFTDIKIANSDTESASFRGKVSKLKQFTRSDISKTKSNTGYRTIKQLRARTPGGRQGNYITQWSKAFKEHHGGNHIVTIKIDKFGNEYNTEPYEINFNTLCSKVVSVMRSMSPKELTALIYSNDNILGIFSFMYNEDDYNYIYEVLMDVIHIKDPDYSLIVTSKEEYNRALRIANKQPSAREVKDIISEINREINNS